MNKIHLPETREQKAKRLELRARKFDALDKHHEKTLELIEANDWEALEEHEKIDPLEYIK